MGSTYGSHTIKLGGMLQGELTYGEFVVTPSASALLQYRHRPGFTDGAGVAIPSSNTVELDIVAGATVSRNFALPEQDAVLQPFVGANALFDATQVTPALVGPVFPGDPFRLQAVGGIGLVWQSGARASIQADVSRGANTTMFGLSGALSVPIR